LTARLVKLSTNMTFDYPVLRIILCYWLRI